MEVMEVMEVVMEVVERMEVVAFAPVQTGSVLQWMNCDLLLERLPPRQRRRGRGHPGVLIGAPAAGERSAP
ncbi:hypothetical protein EYF80_067124 [Liparis tanakae]|uniref:Uncharacterized protein n=1 Tax=Liparis tanakae TaxID=230148 RepID=A0A4Z2E1X5_9TELE|nr:hypothetical protein EYF80_067124 [Liparis tanakae]